MASGVDLRVILVGRTGLNAKLRADPALELLPVRTALEAIGELSDPIDATSPTSAVVIVGSDAAAAASKAAGPKGSLADFINGLRKVDPNVRVLKAADGESNGDIAGVYDGVVRSDQSAEEIGRRIRAILGTPALRAGSSPVAPPRTGSTPRAIEVPGSAGSSARAASAAAPTPAAPEPPPAATSEELDEILGAAEMQHASASADAAMADAALIRAILRGDDPVPILESMLRTRLGRDASIVQDEELRGVGEGVPIVFDARPLGVLHSPGLTESQLEPHAAWVAPWLRLADQTDQLRRAAFTDCLTSAWNRRYFDRYLASTLDRARQSRRNLTVLMFDIDDFKKYNDLFGHAAGDEILTETVKLLRSVIRPSDRVCRIGGDEFAVIFWDPKPRRQPEGPHPQNVFDIATRFQEQIRNHRFPKLGPAAHGTLTISGGLATYPWDGTTVEQLVCRADALAMQCKREGKNAIRYGGEG